MEGEAGMIGWILLGLMFVAGMFVSIYASARWGRGAHSAMSAEMEAESASYVNYGRRPMIGGG
jgi:hypothetical protein